MIDRPDVLVLGAGGVLGERWMQGVLAGIAAETAIDFRRVESFVGTSAGAIVAVGLLAGRAPAGPGAEAAGVEEESIEAAASSMLPRLLGAAVGGVGKVAGAAARPLAPQAVRVTAPVGALLRAGVLGRIPPTRASLDELGRRIAQERLRFDGRLRVVCVERDSGRRVVFGAPGAPTATVAQAVQASCSVPWLYRPVEIDGREYVDGGVSSPTSIDVAPAGRDTQVLVLNPTASSGGDAAARGAVRVASRSAAAVEALLLRRRGAQVQLVGPDRAAAAALAAPLGDDDLAEHALATGFRQGRELARADG